jgi:BirA family biotin operon repressor/biotin-[acetyl-CoA-carboxylase] ligase
MLVDCRDDPPASPGIVFVAALAARETVRALVPCELSVEIKWPNDVLIEGRKVAGILIETANTPLLKRVVGIGINVAEAPAVGMIYPATSLRMEGSAASRDDVLTLLTTNFLSYLALWREGGIAALKADYIRCAYRFGQTVAIRQQDSDYVTGVYEDADEMGILLRLGDGSRVQISAGDVIAAPTPPGLP